MKGFFKLTTAALALVAMASCSNDDFLTNGQAAADAQAEGALQVEMEQLIDGVTTRAAYVPNGTANQLWWQDGDVIIVSDETLMQNDTYEFSWKRSIFENNSKDLVKTPAFAFADNIAGAWIYDKFWDTDKDQVIVRYGISSSAVSGVDNDIASTKGNPVKAYEFALPMWGTATKTDAGVAVSMKYLTGVLRVQMAQLPADWGQIRVRGFEDQACTNPAKMTGVFKAVISEEDEIDENAQLVVPTPAEIAAEGFIYGNEIYVNFEDYDAEALANIRANGGYVYLPVIAQKYGAFMFEYYDSKLGDWKLYKKTKPTEIKRGTVYPTYPTEMKKDKNVITIPAGFKAEALTLDLQGIGGTYPFELESEDGKYEGDVVIDMSDRSMATAPAIFLNLPNSNVTLKGDFAGAYVGVYNQNKLIVKSLTIAPISDLDADKGFPATNVGNIYPNYESFSTGEGIEVQKGTTVGNINMSMVSENNDKFIAKSKIVIKGTAGDIFADRKNPAYSANKKAYYQDIPVTVEGGKAGSIYTASPITLTDATITYATSVWSDITATGETKASSGLYAQEENVIMSGKANGGNVVAKKKADLSGESTAAKATAAEVALSEKASVTTEAKATTLSIVGTAWAQAATMDATAPATTATINLSAEGEAIKGDFTVANTAITLTQGYIKNIAGTTAALTFGEGEGFTALGGITASGLEFKNASTWNGKKIADDFKTVGYVGPYPITGCQLASWDFSLATTLINDIDLNKQAWTPVELKANLNGSEKTIKNLAVTATADNAGLFSKISAGGTIENLTIDGAAVAATGKENVGVLAGSSDVALTINKVVVKNATVEGKYYLGGFVGNTAGNITVDDDSNANGVTFTVNNPNNNPKITDKSDDKAGSVGQYFGIIKGTVKVPACTSTIDPATMGFRAHFKVSPGDKAYCYYGGTRAVGLFTSGTDALTVGGTTMTNKWDTDQDDKPTDATWVGYRLLVSKW